MAYVVIALLLAVLGVTLVTGTTKKKRTRSGTQRLSVDMPPEVRVKIQALADENGHDSVAELLSHALTLYDIVAEEHIFGSKVFIRHQDGTEVPIDFYPKKRT